MKKHNPEVTITFEYLYPSPAERKPLTWTQIFERWSNDRRVLHWNEKGMNFEIKSFYANIDGHFFWWEGGQAIKSDIDSGAVKIYAEPPDPPRKKVAPEDAYVTRDFALANTPECWHGHIEKLAEIDVSFPTQMTICKTDFHINIMKAIGYAAQTDHYSGLCEWLKRYDLMNSINKLTGYCAE